jgi:hypothetical protein
MVTETSVLSLLGQDSRKYHSCVATTFSFDFAFFEMTAMRAFKAAGVRNALVLVDERMLAELFENPSGLEFHANRGYGVFPMSSKGAFHPKIIFCAGRKEGFLAIGSGNLTASGHGHGSELWSVFHLQDVDGITSGIFAQAWSYLKSLTTGIGGNSKEKFHWMESNSPWLAELPKVPVGQPISLSGNTVALRVIEPVTDGLSAIIRDLKGLEVRSITVMSPFYDSDGAFLDALSEAFPAIRIDVILETEFGLLPHRISGSMFRFHDWNKVSPWNDDHKRRLHAKLILFTLTDGGEYAVIGSSNATRPGHGMPSLGAFNHELNCHILWQKSKLLNKLGIQLSKDSVVKISDIPVRNDNGAVGTGESIPKTLRIKFAEHLGFTLHLMTEGTYANPVSVHFFDRHGQFLWRKEGMTLEPEIQISLPNDVNGLAFVAWHDSIGNALSGKQILQNTAFHILGNPDRRLEQLNNIFQGIEDGNFGRVEDLLRFVSFGDDDDSDFPNVISHKVDSSSKGITNVRGEVLTSYEEFTKVPEHVLNRQKGILSSPNVLIAEFLYSLSNRHLALDSIDSDEQTGSLDTDEVEQDVSISKPILRDGNVIIKEKRAVQHFIRKFQTNVIAPWEKLLANAPHRGASTYKPKEITINQLSAYLITAQLMRKYLRRPYIFDIEGKHVSGTYIEIGSSENEIGLSSYTWGVVGPFLTELRVGVKQYHHEALRNKANRFFLESSFMSLLTVCNNHWQNADLPWWNLLMANAVLAAHEAARCDTNQLWTEFSSWLNQTSSSEEFISPQRTEHLKYLRKIVLPRVVPFLHEWDNQRLPLRSAGDLRAGDCIFVSAFGFCLVTSVSTANADGGYAVGITNPGFADVSSPFYRERIEIFKSVLVFDWNL